MAAHHKPDSIDRRIQESKTIAIDLFSFIRFLLSSGSWRRVSTARSLQVYGYRHRIQHARQPDRGILCSTIASYAMEHSSQAEPLGSSNLRASFGMYQLISQYRDASSSQPSSENWSGSTKTTLYKGKCIQTSIYHYLASRGLISSFRLSTHTKTV